MTALALRLNLVAVALLALVGCTPTLRLEMGQAPKDQTQLNWESAITAEINDHELRIQDLEKEIQKCPTHP